MAIIKTFYKKFSRHSMRRIKFLVSDRKGNWNWKS